MMAWHPFNELSTEKEEFVNVESYKYRSFGFQS